MMDKRYLEEVEFKLLQLNSTPKPEKWMHKNYIGARQSQLKFLDLKIPQVRLIFKNGFSFSTLSIPKQWAIWDSIWKNSLIFEVMLFPLMFVDTRPISEIDQHDKKILRWIKRIDNWAHSDGLSKYYAHLLEYNCTKYFPIINKWSNSKNPWEIRQSLVSLFYYSSLRKKYIPFNKIIKIIDKHLHHPHYYVQKGVGWTLRESFNVYPQKTFKYISQHAQLINPVAWVAATEKLSPQEKRKVTLLRKKR